MGMRTLREALRFGMAATVIIAKGASSSTVLTSQAQFHLVFSSLSMAAVQVSVIVALSSKVIDQDQPRPTIGGEAVGESGFHPRSSFQSSTGFAGFASVWNVLYGPKYYAAAVFNLFHV